jgi:hypothetical protein
MSKKSQAGKGDKYRTYSTETFADNYDAINWGHSNRKKYNGKQDNKTDNGQSTNRPKSGDVSETERVE